MINRLFIMIGILNVTKWKIVCVFEKYDWYKRQCSILSSDVIDNIIEDICINWFLNFFMLKKAKITQMYHYVMESD